MSHSLSSLHRIGPYVLTGKTLGSGTTSTVKLAFHKDTGVEVALKIIPKEMLLRQKEKIRGVQREIAVMKLLSHPNVLSLIDVYESAEYLYLVQEYVSGGELFDLLYEKGALPPDFALQIFQNILEGLAYCHSHLICHRDLKPENLLLTANNQLKIADFGMARLMNADFLLTSCGSPHYAAPEIVRGDSYDGHLTDAWSCGVILFALFSGKLPFDHPDMKTLLNSIKVGEFAMPPYIPKNVQDLISRLLVVDPSKRYTIEQCRRHVVLQPFYSPAPPLYPLISSRFGELGAMDSQAMDPDIITNLSSLGCGEGPAIEHSLEHADSPLLSALYFSLKLRKDSAFTLPPHPPPSSPSQGIPAFSAAHHSPPPINMVDALVSPHSHAPSPIAQMAKLKQQDMSPSPPSSPSSSRNASPSRSLARLINPTSLRLNFQKKNHSPKTFNKSSPQLPIASSLKPGVIPELALSAPEGPDECCQTRHGSESDQDLDVSTSSEFEPVGDMEPPSSPHIGGRLRSSSFTFRFSALLPRSRERSSTRLSPESPRSGNSSPRLSSPRAAAIDIPVPSSSSETLALSSPRSNGSSWSPTPKIKRSWFPSFFKVKF